MSVRGTEVPSACCCQMIRGRTFARWLPMGA